MALALMKAKQEAVKSTSTVYHLQKGMISLLSSTVMSQFRISRQSPRIFRNLKHSFSFEEIASTPNSA